VARAAGSPSTDGRATDADSNHESRVTNHGMDTNHGIDTDHARNHSHGSPPLAYTSLNVPVPFATNVPSSRRSSPSEKISERPVR